MNKEIEKRLFDCKNISEFMAMYCGLGMKEKLSIFTEDVFIKKDTFLYRIRRTEGIENPNNPKEWEPVPKRFAHQGRFNAEGESILYVASSPDSLEREVRLEENEEYFLAKYICKKDFCVGSFLGVNNQVNALIHRIAMAVSSASDLSKSENELIDTYYEWARGRYLRDVSVDMLASLYIYKMIPNLYDITNKLGKLVLKKNDNGIRYSSAFVPIELSGAPQIVTIDGMEYGNYALTEKGYANIELFSVEKKSVKKMQKLDIMIKEFAKAEREEI